MHQILFLLLRQFELKYEIEEFHSVFQGQQTTVVQIRR